MSKIDILPAASSSTVPSGSSLQRFGQMKSDIATYYGLDKDDEKVALVGRMLHDIVDDLNSKKLWRFNLIKASDFNTTSGTASYSLSSVAPDLWRIYSLRKSSDIDYLISGLQQRVFDTLFSSQNNITGFPYIRHDFNIFRDGTISLFPIPDGAYTMQLRYFKLISKPSADSDTFDVPSPFQTIFKYGALARVAAFVGPSAMPSTSYWESKYQEAYRDANRMDEDIGDEDLRFINIEEMTSRLSYINPALRPRYLDFY